ncbi:PLDc N-terminal domain-containing protein [Flavisolibacter sp. BT320]|nr:PLDc N-terminal domain-containing protein [Flavisolibacter longurius]
MELFTPELGWIGWVLLLLPVSILWILSLADISKHSFRTPGEKSYWLWLLIIVPLMGAILYFMYGRKNRLHKYKQYNGIF